MIWDMIVCDYFDHPDPGAIDWSSYVFHIYNAYRHIWHNATLYYLVEMTYELFINPSQSNGV